MNTNRLGAIHGLAFFGGGIAGVKLWRAHPVLGFILGSIIAGHIASLATGTNMVELVQSKRASP